MTPDPRYITQNYAGVVESRRRRLSGTVVTIYRSLEAGIESDPDLPYSTVCEDHGVITCHPTLAQARRHAPVAGGCEVCEWRLHGLVHPDDPDHQEEGS